MEKLYQEMREYLQMDTEISFKEFEGYYRTVLNYLNTHFDKMSQDEKIKAKFITSIIESNSEARARRKGPEMKKYRKFQEKMKFWNDAIIYHLKKAGMTEQEIEAALQKLNDDNREGEEEKAPAKKTGAAKKTADNKAAEEKKEERKEDKKKTGSAKTV
ncbi:MAG TPA: hypothetical protein PLJ33_06840 [Peptococcaceae bacterium]|jgi:DNA-binding transcriptional MerR regulator|nr:hypothetical protein [Clostridia bacterium]HOB81361.1 hypothetical protein [Peptococcaceae bacterium]HPZ71540.1 hypothetical protein [Peptococcaceae bacterium]HQD54553.1 hypothetical protein [Peptococcaceae bacterium]